jgi:imidazolonepropionase-like amidohydrolase
MSFLELATEARRQRMRLVGHAPRGTSIAEAAEAGLGSVEHAETVMLALGAAPDSTRVTQLRAAAKAGLFVTPTLVAARTLWLTPDSVARAVLADSAGVRDPERQYVSRRALSVWSHALELNKRGADQSVDWPALYRRQAADMRLARTAGVRFLAGTDLGSLTGLYPGAGLHEELELLVRDAGLTPIEALQSATMAPAAFFGRGRTKGVIAPGADADLLVLEANPLTDITNTRRIQAVMLGGRLLQRVELHAMLAGVAANARTGTDCATPATRQPGGATR